MPLLSPNRSTPLDVFWLKTEIEFSSHPSSLHLARGFEGKLTTSFVGRMGACLQMSAAGAGGDAAIGEARRLAAARLWSRRAYRAARSSSAWVLGAALIPGPGWVGGAIGVVGMAFAEDAALDVAKQVRAQSFSFSLL